ncbi:hypothetical protein PV325_001651 [Microctonus aethiopoides]|nr:hypothetical protein PV325_001651 [Microctonus aethiopoides]
MAEIEILNHDVLREIFSYLDIYDRVRMGLVCKKWHNVIEIMMGSIHKMWLCVIDDDKLERILQIRHDVLELSANNPTDLEKCTQLKYARFECSKSRSLRLLLEALPTENLETLSMQLLGLKYRGVRPEWNHLMGNILSKTPKLKALELNFVPISELSSIGGMGTLETLYKQQTYLV